jgi:hypothetical protein
LRWRVQLGLFVTAWAIYDVARWVAAGELGLATDNARWVMDLEHSTGIAAGLLVSVAGYVVGTRVSRLVQTRSFGLPRLRLRPAIAEAAA